MYYLLKYSLLLDVNFFSSQSTRDFGGPNSKLLLDAPLRRRCRGSFPSRKTIGLGEFPVLHLGCVEIFHIFESWSVVENVTSDEFRYKYLNCKYIYYKIIKLNHACDISWLYSFFRSGCSKCHETYLTDLPPNAAKKRSKTEANHSHLECLGPRPRLLELCSTAAQQNQQPKSWAYPVGFFPGFLWVFLVAEKGLYRSGEKWSAPQQWPLKMYRYTKTVWGLRHSKGICLTPVSSNRSRYHGFLPSQNFKVWRVLRCCSNHCPVWLYKKLYGVIVDLSMIQALCSSWFIQKLLIHIFTYMAKRSSGITPKIGPKRASWSFICQRFFFSDRNWVVIQTMGFFVCKGNSTLSGCIGVVQQNHYKRMPFS